MNDAEQRAEDIRALGFLLAEWGKAVADYAATVGAPDEHRSGALDIPQRRAIVQQQKAWNALEDTSKRFAIVLSRHWRPSGDDS